MPSIRIIGTPPGEAPEHIRRAWIGVVIPLPEDARRWRSPSRGQVLDGPRLLVNTVLGLVRGRYGKWESHAVEAMEAFDALRRHNAEAAEWWSVNAHHLMRPGRKIEFPARVCELVEGVPAGSP